MLRATGLLAVGIALAGCTGDIVENTEGMSPVAPAGLDEVFERVGADTHIPTDLLAAIGYVETRWQMIEGAEEMEGAPRAFGLMAVREDQIAHAASLAGVDADDVRLDPEANVRAAAALLLEQADAVGLDTARRDDLGAWAPAVAAWSRIADDESRAEYVLRDVYGVLQDGVTGIAESGEVIATVAAHPDVVPDYDYTFPVYAVGTDYPGATSKPSPNYSSRPTGTAGKVVMVIIHTCEGGYAGCVGWLRNTQAGVSAHYVVKEDGGEISQLVREASKAWHIGATYKCSLNSNTECARNGASSNNFTVGIEHAGFASQASWPQNQIQQSAKLVCDIATRNAIPIDRQHIVGHGQLQPYNRVDPGANWPWSDYIDRIRTACGGGGGGTPPPPGGDTTITIDSNQANNDGAVAKIELTGTWNSSNSVAGYYGSGYWYADTSPVSQPATFSFYLAAPATRTIDAWWTAASDRSTSATFIMQDAAGTELGRASKNQTTSGSQWVTLGTYNFSAGWNHVVLSRWQAAGKVVIADAVRVR
jgi:hypothetical protein